MLQDGKNDLNGTSSRLVAVRMVRFFYDTSSSGVYYLDQFQIDSIFLIIIIKTKTAKPKKFQKLN
jgi:hypothetical protein